jgi:hypothetical protein
LPRPGSRQRLPRFPKHGSKAGLTQWPHLPIYCSRVQPDWRSWDVAVFNSDGRGVTLRVKRKTQRLGRGGYGRLRRGPMHDWSKLTPGFRLQVHTGGSCCSPDGTGGRNVGCCRTPNFILGGGTPSSHPTVLVITSVVIASWCDEPPSEVVVRRTPRRTSSAEATKRGSIPAQCDGPHATQSSASSLSSLVQQAGA